MAWHGIVGHDEVVEQFRRRLARGRLASTYLFVGPAGVGKRSFALKLAQALLCREHDEKDLDCCGRCPSCVQVAANTHPDLLLVARPPERAEIPVALLIGSKERRMQEGLCHDIGLKPFMGGRRIAIIDDADHLNEEGANCLLKTLEEPPPRSVMILIGTSADRQLPTIRSRSQIVRFAPLEPELAAGLLMEEGLAADRREALVLAERSGGSLQKARHLADEALWDFRRQLYDALAQYPLASVALAKAVSAFVDAAGKEAPPRRERARLVIGFAAEFYRRLLRALAGVADDGDQELARMVDRARAVWPGDVETAAACAQRCLEALEQIDRNANQATFIECWLDDLGQLVGGAVTAA